VNPGVSEEIKRALLAAQKNEITEHLIYRELSKSLKEPNNRKILERIAQDELKHYNFWRDYTGEDVKPNQFKVWSYVFISRLFGITFGIKIMERGEERAQETYEMVSKSLPIAKSIVKEEDEHEAQLVNLIDEDFLKYVGSIILGLNDALVELTGALAGFTLAFQNGGMVAMAGLISGFAASVSMAASEYLSTKTEGGPKNPLKASWYTGLAYVLTVLFLIFPYFAFSNIYLSLCLTIMNAIIVIVVFTFYVSVVKSISFRKRFLEMATISLGVAALTFVIGFVLRTLLPAEV